MTISQKSVSRCKYFCTGKQLNSYNTASYILRLSELIRQIRHHKLFLGKLFNFSFVSATFIVKTIMTEQEFTYLSHRIRGKLTALAKRFNRVAGCDGDAEDVVQDALITLWQLAEKGYPIRDPEALAVKITKTCCVERYRRQHIRFEPIENMSIADGASAASGTEEMDTVTIRGIVQRGLTNSQRKLLTLRNDCGLSLDEIAVATGRPKSSIKVALSTARRKMMEQWKKMK